MKKSKFKPLELKQLSESTRNKKLVPADQIGTLLKSIRTALGITQKQMAKKLGITQATYSTIEKNTQSNSLKTISRITNALNCEFMGAIVPRQPLEEIIEIPKMNLKVFEGY